MGAAGLFGDPLVSELIGAIREATPPDRLRGDGTGVVVGIGDDCAVLRTDADSRHDLLLKTDMLVEGRHWTEAAAPEDVGWKALAVNLSDVAAMGGRPLHTVLALALRPEQTGEFADRLVAGLLDCAVRYDCALVGGDTNATDGPAVVSVAMTGWVPRGRAVLRSGAWPGDAVFVTGALGGSLRGRHLRVRPRLIESAALVEAVDVHAMIDISDGLSSDLGHVLDASGVGAEIWARKIPVHDDAIAAAREGGGTPIEHALHDGEDFELLFTAPAEFVTVLVAHGLAGTLVSHVGWITSSHEYVLVDPEGARRPMDRRGYEHFAETRSSTQ